MRNILQYRESAPFKSGWHTHTVSDDLIYAESIMSDATIDFINFDFRIVLVNNTGTCISGTHGQGSIEVSYAKIVAILGEPDPCEDSIKIDAEWTIEIDGEVATLYNWKNGPSYGGLPVNRIRRWNIGGHSPKAIKIIKELLTNQGEEQ